jgi:cyanate lyase
VPDQIGLSFEDLAKATDRDEIYIAAVCYGQAKPLPEDIAKLSSALGLEESFIAAPGAGLGADFFPVRG